MDKTEIEAKLDELRREKDNMETALNETSQQRDKLDFEFNKLKEMITFYDIKMLLLIFRGLEVWNFSLKISFPSSLYLIFMFFYFLFCC